MASTRFHHFALRSLSCRRAFTLIELLVVIAIIGVLAALLFSVLGNIKKSAQSAKTVSHLRQIQTADLLFATDNNGFFLGNAPGPLSQFQTPWWSYEPFIRLLGVSNADWVGNYPEVFKCGPHVSVAAPPGDDRNFTIAMNMTGWSHRADGTVINYFWEWWNYWSPGQIQQLRVKNPSKFIMFYEATSFVGYMDDRLKWPGDNGPFTGGFPQGMAFRNSGGTCNAVFADGHVAGIKREDVAKDSDAAQMFWFDPAWAGF